MHRGAEIYRLECGTDACDNDVTAFDVKVASPERMVVHNEERDFESDGNIALEVHR